MPLMFVSSTATETGKEQVGGEYQGVLEIYNTVHGLAAVSSGFAMCQEWRG